MPSGPPNLENARLEILLLLGQMGAENSEAEARLMPLIYEHLRRLARHYLRFERSIQLKNEFAETS